MTQTLEYSDAQLVTRTLSGDREAFADIVKRYQSLICALTYNATGSFAQSEDLAQEIFVNAWKNLRSLQEPQRLRAWLCGIARNLINSSFRTAKQEQKVAAAHAEDVLSQAFEPAPSEQAITREEQALLWRSLEQLPEAYREPLILYYRQQHSIERVAETLELSEDAVKQRLSRGRKMLHEQVAAFVEHTLGRSNPGKTFAAVVLLSIPVVTTSAKAATLGAAAAKGSTAAKTAGLLGAASALMSPMLMLFGYWTQYRASMDVARNAAERNHVRGFFIRLVACIGACIAAIACLGLFGRQLQAAHPAVFSWTVVAIAGGYLFVSIWLFVWTKQRERAWQKRSADAGSDMAPTALEFRTKLTFLGLPLICARLNRSVGNDVRPAKGWIATGDFAVSPLFAFGGVAIAPISVGGVALGMLSFGGWAIGIIAMGGFANAAWAFGGLAIGWQAFGGLALAWNASAGGIAVAHAYALGGIAQATQANNEIAQRFVQSTVFFSIGEWISRYAVFVNALWVVPLILWRRTLNKHRL